MKNMPAEDRAVYWKYVALVCLLFTCVPGKPKQSPSNEVQSYPLTYNTPQ